jgi:hypothetical protein
MKNSNDTTRNRTHDPPTCSAVPQPAALPRAPLRISVAVRNILRQPICSIFKGPAVLTTEDGKSRLSTTSVYNYQHTLHNITEQQRIRVFKFAKPNLIVEVI